MQCCSHRANTDPTASHSTSHLFANTLLQIKFLVGWCLNVEFGSDFPNNFGDPPPVAPPAGQNVPVFTSSSETLKSGRIDSNFNHILGLLKAPLLDY